MIKNIEFRQVRDDFQDQLQHDIRKINNSTKAFIPADKTNNYEVDKTTHDKLMDSITSTYKKANTNTIITINNEAKDIATNLNIVDRAEPLPEIVDISRPWLIVSGISFPNGGQKTDKNDRSQGKRIPCDFLK